jgi:polysaccharide pyruvyl transferase WcaK-like protein
MRALVLNDTSTSNHFGCYAVMSKIHEELTERGFSNNCYFPSWGNLEALMKAVEDTRFDLILVNGEGTVHNTDERPYAKDLIAIAARLSKNMDAPLHIVNASFFNLDAQTLSLLATFDSVYVRETVSQNYLEQHSIRSRFAPDLSFLYPYRLAPVRNQGTLCTDSVNPEVSELLRDISRFRNFNFLTLEPRRKNSLLKSGYGKLKRVMLGLSKPQHLLSKEPRAIPCGFHSYIDALTTSKAVLTGRFHTATMAIATRTPFLAIESNTPKISAVLLDVFGEDSRQIESGVFTQDAAELAEVSPYSSEELQKIEDYMDLSVVRAREMFDEISMHSTSLSSWSNRV